MAKPKKPKPPTVHLDGDGNPFIKLPAEFESLDEISYRNCGTMHVSEDPLVGTLTITFGPYYVDVIITDEDAEEIIQALTSFLKGRSKNLLTTDDN